MAAVSVVAAAMVAVRAVWSPFKRLLSCARSAPPRYHATLECVSINRTTNHAALLTCEIRPQVPPSALHHLPPVLEVRRQPSRAGSEPVFHYRL